MGENTRPLFICVLFCLIVYVLSSEVKSKVKFPKQGNGTNRKYIDILGKITHEATTLLKKRLDRLQAELKERNAGIVSARKKRAAIYDNPPVQQLGSLEIVEFMQQHVDSVIVDCTFIQTSSNSYLVGAGREHLNGSRYNVPSPIWKWDPKKSMFELMATVMLNSAVDVEGFIHNDEAYFIFAINAKDQYMDFAPQNSKLYKISERNIKVIQSIRTIGATKWKSAYINKELYLFQVSYLRWKRSSKRLDMPSYQPKASTEIRVFKWMSRPFKELGGIQGSHSTDLDITTVKGKTLMAVVNQTIGEEEVESTLLIYEILTYNKAEHGFQVKLLQRINGWYISSVQFVTVGNDLFVAVAYQFRVQKGTKIIVSKVDSVIYRYNGMYFVKYQSIESSCAIQWVVIHGPEGTTALLLHSDLKDEIYEYVNGVWMQQPTANVLGQAGARTKGIISLTLQDTNLLSLFQDGTIRFLKLNFQEQEDSNRETELLSACSRVKNQAQQLRQRVDKLYESTQLFTLTTDQRVQGQKIFEMTRMKNMYVNQINISNSKVFQGIVKSKLETLQSVIASFPSDFSNLLMKEKPQVIKSSTIVRHVKFDHVEAKSAQWKITNGIDFCDHIKNVMWLSSPILKIDQLQFESLDFKNSIEVVGHINNVRFPRDVVNLRGSNFIRGRKIFPSRLIIQGNLNIESNINGIQPENILLTNVDQEIKGHFEVHADAMVNELRQLNENNFINNVQWSWMKSELLMINAPAEFRGKMEFLTNMTVVHELRTNNLIGGVNVSHLLTDSIKLHQSENFLTSITFNNVKFIDNVMLKGPMNHVRVPQELVLINEMEWNLNLDFLNTIAANSLTVMGTVNNIHINRNQIMTTKDNQKVTGRKHFRDIMTTNSIIVHGHLNRENLTELLSHYKATNVRVNPSYGQLKVKSLHATQLPIKLHTLLRESILINVPYNFRNRVEFKSVTTVRSNVLAPNTIFSDLELTKSEKTLNLQLEALSSVYFKNDIRIEGHINNVNLTQFYSNVMLITGTNYILNPKIFVDDIHISENSLLYGQVNNVYLSDMVKITENYTSTNVLNFKAPPIIKTSRVHQTNVINLKGKLVDEWFADTLMIDQEQVVVASKTFMHGLTIGEFSRVTDRGVLVSQNFYFYKFNLVDMIDASISSRKNTEISNSIVFVADTVIENLYVDYVDNIDINQFLKRSLKQVEDRCVILTTVEVEEIVTPIVNAFNVNRFLENAVKKTDIHLPGGLKFAHVSARNIDVSGLVNKVKFSSDVILRNAEETNIYGPKQFRSLTTKLLTVHNLINNVNLGQLNNSILKQNLKQTIPGTLNVQTLIVKGNLNGPIANFDLENFLHDVVYVDRDVRISGYKEFGNVIYNPMNGKELQVGGFVDNTDLTYLYNNMATLDTEQTIRGPMNFSSLSTQYLEVANIVGSPILKVNDDKLQEWEKTIMKKSFSSYELIQHKIFTDSIKITSNIIVDGMMNKLKMEDMILKDSTQKIYNVNFHQISVNSLQLKGNLMNVNVTDWFVRTVPKNSVVPVVIHQKKTFQNVILKNANNMFKQTLNNIEISNVMTVRDNQVITSPVHFKKNINMPRWSRVEIIPTLALKVETAGIGEMFDVPLPYPCKDKTMIHKFGSCYEIIPYDTSRSVVTCLRGSPVLNATTNEIDFFGSLGIRRENERYVIENSPLYAYICKQPARTRVPSPVLLKGKFRVKDGIVHHLQQPVLSPAQDRYEIIYADYITSLNVYRGNSRTISSIHQNICSTLKEINETLANSLQTWTPPDFFQTLNNNIKKIIPIKDVTQSFIAVEVDGLTKYILQGTNFKIASRLTIAITGHILNMGLDFFQNDGLLYFLPINQQCPLNMVDHLDIYTTSLPNMETKIQRLMFIPDCVPVKNLAFAIIERKPVLLTGIGKHFEILMQYENGTFHLVAKQTETLEIVQVVQLDSHGHVLTVTKADNDRTFFTVYKFDVERKTILRESMHSFPKPSSKIVNFQTNLQLIMLHDNNLQLLQYHPEKKNFFTKQVIRIQPGVTGVTQLQGIQNNLIISYCGYSDFYTLTDYLVETHRVEASIIGQPVSIQHNHESYIFVRVASHPGDCSRCSLGNWIVLRAAKLGSSPLLCNLQCNEPDELGH